MRSTARATTPSRGLVWALVRFTLSGGITGGQAYWFTFLAKYVTKSKVGNAAGIDATQGAITRQSIFYNCPAWAGYQRGGVVNGDTNIVQPGFGMNPFPAYTYDARPDPINVVADVRQAAVIDPNGGTRGVWYRARAWTHPSERALIADSKYWLAQSNSPPPTGYPTAGSNSWPQAVYPQPAR